MTIRELWYSNSESDWDAAEKRYQRFIRPGNVKLEDELESKMRQVRTVADIQRLGLGDSCYDLLLNKYFRWKYTQPNRYATTSQCFRAAYEQDQRPLTAIVEALLGAQGKEDAKRMLEMAVQIPGLGVAGASGLLALLSPLLYGTVDQFAVRNLQQLADIPEHRAIASVNPMAIGKSGFILITDIYRTKAEALNRRFSCTRWTPRRIDRVLWSLR